MSSKKETNSLPEIIASGEGPTIEFKKSDILSNSVHLAKEMVALANSLGGRILIGVCDDGTIEGMKKKKEHETHVMNIARDKCDPPLTPVFLTINVLNSDIYDVKISRYKTIPHAVKTDNGRVYFIRVGTTVREATPLELGTLFEANGEEIAKKPNLELYLIDAENNPTNIVNAKPVFTTVKKVNVPYPTNPFFKTYALTMKNMTPFLHEKKPSPELVPIKILLANEGQAPAQNVRISVEFPENCELFNKSEFEMGIYPTFKRTSGGLYRVHEYTSEATAWTDDLGNDLVCNFDEIYVKFPPETKEHKIKGRVTQNYHPPKDFEFNVKVEPEFKEVTEEVYEENIEKPEEKKP